MLTQEDYWMIQERLKQGVYQKDIAAELGVHPKTVRRALARGGPPANGRRRRRFTGNTRIHGRTDTIDIRPVTDVVGSVFAQLQANLPAALIVVDVGCVGG